LREDTTDRNNNKRITPNSPKANKTTNKQQNPSTKSCRPEQHQHHTKIPSSKRGNKKKIQLTTHNSSQKNKKKSQQQTTIHNSNNKSLSTDPAKETKGKICARNKGWKKKHTNTHQKELAAYTQVATNFMICVQCQ
jgi:hypothetical protein